MVLFSVGAFEPVAVRPGCRLTGRQTKPESIRSRPRILRTDVGSTSGSAVSFAAGIERAEDSALGRAMPLVSAEIS